MKNTKQVFICSNCSNQSTQWEGRCHSCGEWNSYEEQSSKNKMNSLIEGEVPSEKLSSLKIEKLKRFDSGLVDVNRVFGGGIVEGSLTLISGDPGVGKSTLLLKIASEIASNKSKVIYASAEETMSQIGERAKRLNIKNEDITLINENTVEKILSFSKKNGCSLLIIDSIQTIYNEEVSSTMGSTNQVKTITSIVMDFVKKENVAAILVGHITKEGGVAGPKVLEHMVDTVINFEKDLHSNLRILNSSKNRFGNTQEVGLLEMKETGLEDVHQGLLEGSKNKAMSIGSALSCELNVNRVLITDIESLVNENKYGTGKKVIKGEDTNKVSLIIAVLEKYTELSFTFDDVYMNKTNVIKNNTHESDLAIAASIISSKKNKLISRNSVFVARISLTGELFTDSNINQKIKVLSKYNFDEVIIGKTETKILDNYPINIKQINRVEELVNYL